VSPITLKVQAAQKVPPDAHAPFREDFLRAVSQVGLGRDQAVALVEASSGRPFAACGPSDLLPILIDLLRFAQRTTRAHVHRGPPCNG
jgi:hypothetical protein